MHFTPEELKSFPLWAVEENNANAIMQWLGDWRDVIHAVQSVPVEIPDWDVSEPKRAAITPVPIVVKWLHFVMSELGELLKMQHDNCDLVTAGAHGALLSNGDLLVMNVRVANHTGKPFDTHTLCIEKAPTVLFTRGLGRVLDAELVPTAVTDAVYRHLEHYPYNRQSIVMPSLEDLVWTRASGYPYSDTLTDEQQLMSVLTYICSGTDWSINLNHVTFANGTLYTTPECPISGAINLRG